MNPPTEFFLVGVLLKNDKYQYVLIIVTITFSFCPHIFTELASKPLNKFQHCFPDLRYSLARRMVPPLRGYLQLVFRLSEKDQPAFSPDCNSMNRLKKALWCRWEDIHNREKKSSPSCHQPFLQRMAHQLHPSDFDNRFSGLGQKAYPRIFHGKAGVPRRSQLHAFGVLFARYRIVL